MLFGSEVQPKPVARDPRRSELPNENLKRVPILPMFERGVSDVDGLFSRNQERIDECRDLGSHIWVRSLITTYRTKFPLAESVVAKYYRDDASVFWCQHCGHSLRERAYESKKITAREYFDLIAPNTASYPGIDPTWIEGWITTKTAPDAPIPHDAWEKSAFLKGAWTR